MMTGFDMGVGMAGGWLWPILGVVFVVTVVGFAVGAFRDRSNEADDPARILKSRLARGEISPEQYERARRQLGL